MDDDPFIMFVLGADPAKALQVTIKRLCAEGLLQFDGYELRITEAGLKILLDYSRSIDHLNADRQGSLVH
jgi:hypothetical protein